LFLSWSRRTIVRPFDREFAHVQMKANNQSGNNIMRTQEKANSGTGTVTSKSAPPNYALQDELVLFWLESVGRAAKPRRAMGRLGLSVACLIVLAVVLLALSWNL